MGICPKRCCVYPLPVTDALSYDLHLRRLGSSSSYRVEHEQLANYYLKDIGEKPGPKKLLEQQERGGRAWPPIHVPIPVSVPIVEGQHGQVVGEVDAQHVDEIEAVDHPAR